MTKPRATTIQQRFGFLDNDLMTPVHDEMILWLDKNMESIISDLFLKDWQQRDINALMEDARNVVDNQIKALQEYTSRSIDLSIYWGEALERRKQEIADRTAKLERLQSWEGLGTVPQRTIGEIEVTWEFPVATGRDNKYIVGFIDLMAEYSLSELYLKHVSTSSYGPSGLLRLEEDELPEWGIYYNSNTVFFEVKSSIPSLGELVRQIRMYKTYVRGRFYIVCPDDRFRGPLEGQGIGFIKYPI